jgi:predicted alpha/beta-fold hydrolase
MKLLGEQGGAAPTGLVAAAAISPPFELEPTARHLDRPRSFFYRSYLLRTLRAKALEKIARFPEIARLEPGVREARIFAEFDEAFTAPVHGFADARDYWTRCSGARFVATIARPLCIVASLDDPFFPEGYVPVGAVARNPLVDLVLAPRGGHVGFVAGSPLAPRFWADEVAVEHLERAFTSM